ncbi:MAG: hypothetical protein RIR17_2036, partial [Planctomycetota bacterium]
TNTANIFMMRLIFVYPFYRLRGFANYRDHMAEGIVGSKEPKP